MANYTKKVLSITLQELMKEKPLNDITVQELVDQASMNRKTFYYHFHTLSDLLKWCLKEDLKPLKINLSHPKLWSDHVKNILYFLKDNKYFFYSMHYSNYDSEMRLYLKELTEQTVALYENQTWQNFISKQKYQVELTDSQRNYIVKFFSGALFTLIEDWFLSGMNEPIDAFIIVLKKLINQNICHTYEVFIEG